MKVIYKNTGQDYTALLGRIQDKEKNVTCWVYRGFKAGGLSCIPNKNLKGK